MLTDVSLDEEFELKEEEPWYDKQDLERDLQLAAELGKSLLERNHELEQSLQQMCANNQEQVQEIEHLSKQVDLLRQVNDQHAKVYEQLDVVARELEQSNRKLTQDHRASQQKIHRLTETVEQLQAQVEELQHQLEEVKLGPSLLAQEGQWRTRRAQSVSCLEELQRPPEEPCGDQECCGVQRWHEDQQASLRHTLRRLQTQYAGERTRREEAEREAGLLNRENAALEQQLAGMERCKVRVSELEREAEELRGLWKSRSFARCDSEEEEEMSRRPFKRWASERLLKAHDSAREHEYCCARRAQVVKQRGISLLNEVDAQYSALQVKYDQLLGRLGQQRHHDDQEEEEEECVSPKEVQTLTVDSLTVDSLTVDSLTVDSLTVDSLTVDSLTKDDHVHQPEYKLLFREIFSRLNKTKEDLVENRMRRPAGQVASLRSCDS
ncbi:cerebellar degeneration-related protein 2-like isoform X2 [Entelurus aequoreus]|uniref:cerebellar degeneration-related protein 2-like isoform X2 n=1 Tax=Entelurus aequoreus TaxID=161455 RepID=UPI002B1D2A15|nr:cerebellar degeneration-related protein 2-like isoform X2 [Entelurus aequoreus]